jgi:hypothetical protein
MSTEKIITGLTPHLETAEKAVAAVKDPRLREIAFGRILDHLLASHNPGSDKTSSVSTEKYLAKQTSKTTTSTGVTAWLKELVEEGVFAEPKSIRQIIQELSNRSHHLRSTDLTRQMQQLCHEKTLRRRKQAPAGGGKELFHWSNW